MRCYGCSNETIEIGEPETVNRLFDEVCKLSKPFENVFPSADNMNGEAIAVCRNCSDGGHAVRA